MKFQIKRTTNNVLLANQHCLYWHCPQVKSHLSCSSSSPGHSQLTAEPSNQTVVAFKLQKIFQSTKGQRSRFGPAPHHREKDRQRMQRLPSIDLEAYSFDQNINMEALLILLSCIALSCGEDGGSKVAIALVQSFPPNTQISTSVSGIPFEYFREKPVHLLKSRLSIQQFTSTVNDIIKSYELDAEVKNALLDAQYAEVNKEVIQKLKFTRGKQSNAIYGRIATIKREDGTIDLAQAIHEVDFQLKPEIIQHKKVRRNFWGRKRTKRWEEKKERTLSENERQYILSFVQGKSLSGFSAKFAAQISGTCSAGSAC